MLGLFFAGTPFTLPAVIASDEYFINVSIKSVEPASAM